MGTRKPATRLAVPAQRYFKGKAPVKGADPLTSDSDDVEEEVEPQNGQDEAIAAYGEQDEVVSKASNAERQPSKAERSMKVELRDVKVSAEGKIIGAAPIVSTSSLGVQVEKESSSEEEEDEEVSESSEEESESEDELPKPSQFRPVFVPKRGRGTLKERDAETFDSEEAVKKREAAAEERKRQSHKMVGETIKRALEEKEAPEPGREIDDTDSLDPEAEFEAWRLRELQRIKRTKEAEVKREEERLERERRLAMPEEQRLKEDLELANKSRESKPKGQGAFLQKYWHKGAYFQDEDILKRHDFSAPLASQVDVSLLPKVMQVKDFGKRSRTKWTHLRSEDTSATTNALRADGQPISCFGCGGPHLKKDCPSNTGPLSERPIPVTGANGTPNMPRKWGNDARREDARSWRDSSPEYRSSRGDVRDKRQVPRAQRDHSWDGNDRRDGGRRRPEMDRKRDYDSRRYSNSRSRSPRQRRSRSPRHNRRESDYPERKRRRVEA